MQQLELVKEAKIFDILEGSLDPRLEASGVLARDGLFYVIFDNLPHIACIGPELSPAARDNHMIMQDRGHRRGFEDIAYDARSGRFYVLIEARGRAKFMAAVQEYDRLVMAAPGYFLTGEQGPGRPDMRAPRRAGLPAGLCEGNRCKGGAEGGIPEAGGSTCPARPRNWDRVGKIRCRKRCSSRTTAASPSSGTGSRSYPRHPRHCGSATSRRMLAGHRPGHELRAPDGRRWQHRLRDAEGVYG